MFAEERWMVLGKAMKQNRVKWSTDLPYLLIALIYPFSFVYFFLIGFRTDSRKWKIAGAVYMAFILLLPLFQTRFFTILISLAASFVCSVNAFLSHRQYLNRLEAIRERENMPEAPLDSRIDAKNGPDEAESKASADETREPGAASQGNVRESGAAGGDLPSGNRFVRQVREMNVAIEDETVSGYLNEIELLLGDIFAHLDKYPEKKDKVATLEKYYMPETIKLLERYVELSETPIRTRHVEEAMADVEEMLKTVIDAFRKLYDDLLRDITSGISTDIKVLKDVFSQNGLIRREDDLTIGRTENDGEERRG